VRVADIMQKEVATLHPEDALDLAESMMKIGRFRHLPVITPGGDLVGLVSRGLLMRHSISCKLQLGERTEREWLSGIRADEVMTRDLFSVTPDADLLDIVDAMATRRIGCVPVVRDGRLVGIVTETDCLAHLKTLLRASRVDAERASLKRFRALPDLNPGASAAEPKHSMPRQRTTRVRDAQKP